MGRSLNDQVRETIQEFAMIRAGVTVAVACSGGADSTALLLLLHEMAGALGCVLSAAHVNHCLRGDESDGDEQFARELAGRLGIPFYPCRLDAAVRARESKKNLEAAARDARLQFFASLVREGKATRVATAHTADDQAETVLHRLIRGAGTRGLSGILPLIDGGGDSAAASGPMPVGPMPAGPILVRPLIAVRRADLRAWLGEKGERWREDSSNQDRRFTRNRIRHDLLPQLEQINPGIVDALSRTAAIAREEEEFWRDYVRPLCAAWVKWTPDGAVIDLEHLARAPRAVACRVLRWTFGRLADAGPAAGNFLHVEQIFRWAIRGQSGQSLTLPHGLEARREFSHLILMRQAGGDAQRRSGFCCPVSLPSTVEVPVQGRRMRLELVDLPGPGARYNERGSILLDAKLAESPLSLRNWRAGDAYQPKGHRSPKKLHDFFQRMRIPRGERNTWPVLVAGERIVWVRGLPVAEQFSPSPESVRAIEIRELS